MGQKRKADRSLKLTDEPFYTDGRGKCRKFSGMPVRFQDCEALLPCLLASTAQYRVHERLGNEEKFQRPGKTTRAMARAQADQEEATPVALKPLPKPAEALSREEVLARRLQHVRELKTFYSRAYVSMLAHLVDLASAMKQVQKPVLHDPDPPAPRSSDKDASADGNSSRKASDRQDEPMQSSARKEGVLSPKGVQRADGVTSPRTADGIISPRPSGDAAPKTPSSAKRSARLPSFSDVEEEALLRFSGRSKNGAAVGSSVYHERLAKAMPAAASLQMISNNLEGLADLERLASSAATRDMDAHQACAVLCGRNIRFYLHQTMVIIGRKSKTKGEVDIDLTLEGPTTKLSRIQCLMELDLEIGFVLRNLGRQSVLVNNIEVQKGHKIKVPHLSLLEIGGIHVLFLFNHDAVRRMALQPLPCPKDMGQHAWA